MLFFVDNIRFTQAGSEVSALLGRIPSAVGYQPTLATDMGALQERITTTRKGSITSVQAIYVPADDLMTRHQRHHLPTLMRPLPYRVRSPNWGSTRLLIRSIQPPAFDPRVVGEEHYNVARQVQAVLQQYGSLQDIIAILTDELSEEDKLTVSARKIQRFLAVPCCLCITGAPASWSA